MLLHGSIGTVSAPIGCYQDGVAVWSALLPSLGPRQLSVLQERGLAGQQVTNAHGGLIGYFLYYCIRLAVVSLELSDFTRDHQISFQVLGRYLL